MAKHRSCGMGRGGARGMQSLRKRPRDLAVSASAWKFETGTTLYAQENCILCYERLRQTEKLDRKTKQRGFASAVKLTRNAMTA